MLDEHADDFNYAIRCAKLLAHKHHLRWGSQLSYEQLYSAALYGLVLADRAWKPGLQKWRFYIYRRMEGAIRDDVRSHHPELLKWRHKTRGGPKYQVKVLPDVDRVTYDHLDSQLEVRDVLRQIRQLGGDDWTAERFWVLGWSAESIAEHDNVTRAAVYRRLCRIREVMRAAAAVPVQGPDREDFTGDPEPQERGRGSDSGGDAVVELPGPPAPGLPEGVA